MTTSLTERAVDRRGIMHDLRAVLEAGHRRATQCDRPVLASHTFAVRDLSPLAVFSTARDSGVAGLWYWEQPSTGCALIGIGIATSIEYDGPDAMSLATRRWRALTTDSIATHAATNEVPALAAFAGFAFDPAAKHAALWEGFPAAALIVPRLLVRWENGTRSATVAALIHPGDSIDAHAHRLEATFSRLEAPDITHTVTVASTPDMALTIADGPRERRAYEDLVTLARERTRTGELRKVVAARAVAVEGTAPFEPAAVLARLRGGYPTATVFAVQRIGATFLGATPERLARVSDGRIETMALAGTVPRGATPAKDEALAAALRENPKNREEHAIVVASIRDALAPLCGDIRSTDAPRLRRLPNVQHLETPIAATLAPGRDLLDVAAALHPTPAVGGLPRDRAAAFIRRHEGRDRGWYASPLGWVDARGNGELVVALRSALLRGRRATLFAGCGIVPDSDPTSEYEESRFKLRAMLGALSDGSAGGAR